MKYIKVFLLTCSMLLMFSISVFADVAPITSPPSVGNGMNVVFYDSGVWLSITTQTNLGYFYLTGEGLCVADSSISYMSSDGGTTWFVASGWSIDSTCRNRAYSVDKMHGTATIYSDINKTSVSYSSIPSWVDDNLGIRVNVPTSSPYSVHWSKGYDVPLSVLGPAHHVPDSTINDNVPFMISFTIPYIDGQSLSNMEYGFYNNNVGVTVGSPVYDLFKTTSKLDGSFLTVGSISGTLHLTHGVNTYTFSVRSSLGGDLLTKSIVINYTEMTTSDVGGGSGGLTNSPNGGFGDAPKRSDYSDDILGTLKFMLATIGYYIVAPFKMVADLFSSLLDSISSLMVGFVGVQTVALGLFSFLPPQVNALIMMAITFTVIGIGLTVLGRRK